MRCLRNIVLATFLVFSSSSCFSLQKKQTNPRKIRILNYENKTFYADEKGELIKVLEKQGKKERVYLPSEEEQAIYDEIRWR